MNNKKKKNSKRKKVIKKQSVEKKKLLLQMQKEIKLMESQIKHSKIINAKINALKGLKISLRFGQLIAPYAVTAGLTFGLFSLFDGTPFFVDNYKQKLNTMKELDSLGNVRYEQQYDDFENSNSSLSYYGKWERRNDGFYKRNVEVYSIKEVTEDKIIELLNNNNIKSLSDILGEPILKKIEVKNNISEEELKKNFYLQTIMYSEEEKDFKIVQESTGENIALTVVWFLITLLCELAPLYWREEHSYFDFGNCIYKIKMNHPSVNVEEIKKKLQIKKDNYDRLMR